ncbi:Ribonuclease H2 subunit A [Phlyctochytrium planicorne]|nr:Ribonuclease H2 subunit A [Phlyctochytrium planicorne]
MLCAARSGHISMVDFLYKISPGISSPEALAYAVEGCTWEAVGHRGRSGVNGESYEILKFLIEKRSEVDPQHAVEKAAYWDDVEAIKYAHGTGKAEILNESIESALEEPDDPSCNMEPQKVMKYFDVDPDAPASELKCWAESERFERQGFSNMSNTMDEKVVEATIKTPADAMPNVSQPEFYQSTWTHCHVPDSILLNAVDERVIMGIDEAGRGPVLGPMVYATAFVKLKKAGSVGGIGVDGMSCFPTSSISLMDLGGLMQASFCLTQSFARFQKAYGKLSRKALFGYDHEAFGLGWLYVDTVGKEKTYQDYLEKIFPGMKITVAKKADSKYPIVSAASVFAKVTRDYMIKNWIFSDSEKELFRNLSMDFGSGYPGDPKTVAWLKECMDHIFGYPSIVRFSWSTCVQRLDMHATTVIWPDDGEDSKKPKGSTTGHKKKQMKLTKETSQTTEDGSEAEEEEGEGEEGAAPAAEAPAAKDMKKRKASDLAETEDETVLARRKKLEVVAKPLKELPLDKAREGFIRAWGLRHVESFF